VFEETSIIFWYCLLSILVLFVVLFYLFFVLLVSGCYYLDAANFGNLQDLKEEDFEQQLAMNLGKCH
jgi:membrane-anchored glycerophosphoryl diester phosphodiesterase (GDPDase)